MIRSLLLAGVSDRTRAQVTLNVVQQAELLSEARQLDIVIHSLRTEMTVLSSKLDNAQKYIKRLKERSEDNATDAV